MNPLLTALLFICISANMDTPVDQPGRIYISKDQGASWIRSDRGFPADETVNAWTTMDGVIVAGTNAHGIFKSTDHANTWYLSSKGLPKDARIIALSSYRKLIYAGTYKHGIFVSSDGGDSWRAFNSGLQNLSIRCFYTKGPRLLVGTNNGIYGLAENGAVWSLELHGFQVNDFKSTNNQIFVATNQGVLVLNDSGRIASWIYKDAAIYTVAVNKKEINIMDFFGTVYRSSTTKIIWLKADAYLPFHSTFQLTPASNKFLRIEWSGAMKALDAETAVYHNNGLPEDAAFIELLDTPHGLLAGAALPKKIE